MEPQKIRVVTAFAAMLVATTALLAAGLWALERFAGVTLGSGGVGIVPPMVAAIVAGQRHVMAVQAAPRAGYAWSIAAWFAAATFALSAASMAVVCAADAEGTHALSDQLLSLVSRVELAAVFAGLALVLSVILRFASSFDMR